MVIITKIIAYFVLLFAITIHEAAHGWAAMKFGDPTAYHMGRVTLNPIPHIDPIGTVLLPLVMMFTSIPIIGWAKPVPVNPINLRNPRKNNLWISAAGPLSNITAGLSMIVIWFLLRSLKPGFQYSIASAQGGSARLDIWAGLALLLFYGILINFVLCIFNMLPIPPLDGSGVLEGILPPDKVRILEQIRPYGFLIILGLFYIGFFRIIITPVINLLESILF